MATSRSERQRSLEDEMALLTWHLRAARMSATEHATYSNWLVLTKGWKK